MYLIFPGVSITQESDGLKIFFYFKIRRGAVKKKLFNVWHQYVEKCNIKVSLFFLYPQIKVY